MLLTSVRHKVIERIAPPGFLLAAALIFFVLPANAEELREATQTNAPIAALTKLNSLQPRQAIVPDYTSLTVERMITRQEVPVLFIAAPELPMVDVQITFNAGSARDSSIRPKLYGLANLTARLLDEGTPEHSSDDISEQFESLGSSFSAAAYKDMFTVNIRSLTDSATLQPTLSLAGDILQYANFPQANIDRVFDNAIIGQQQQAESPATVANLRFIKELYGDHPYAQPSTGTVQGLRAITRNDLQQFKKTFLVAQNANIAIVGAVSREEALVIAQQLADSLPNGQAAPEITKALPLTEDKTIHVPFESTQTHIILGKLGADRSEPKELLAIAIANSILGGGDFNALLMQELREKRGLTYGAYSQFTPMAGRGPFMISFSTRSDQADQAITVAKKTLDEFIAQPLNPQQFNEVKQQFLLSFPTSLSSNQSKLGYLSMMGFYNLPTSYLTDYPKWIQQLKIDEVKAAFNAALSAAPILLIRTGQ